MPLLAGKEKIEGIRMKYSKLTAHCSGLPEDLGYLRVHLDHYVLLYGHLCVAILNLLLDPIIEGLAEDRGDYVTKPLFRCLGKFELRLW